jgi:tetratricopeptide (TPR) repeat protein
VHEELGNRVGYQFALHNLANAALHTGDAARARELYERVIAITPKDDPNVHFVHVALADVADGQGDREVARVNYEKAIEILGATGNPWGMAYAQASYGQSAARHGEFALARERYERALTTYRQLNDLRGEARVMTLLADVDADEGDNASALKLLYDALEIRCRLGDSPGICSALERFSAGAADVDATRSARILAAASSLRDRTGARLSLAAQAAVDQQLAHLQQTLGDRFSAAWQSGCGAAIDEALREAAAVSRDAAAGDNAAVEGTARRLPGRE